MIRLKRSNLILFALISFLIIGCNGARLESPKNIQETYTNEKQDSLSRVLCQLYGLDQGIRLSPGFEGKYKLIRRIDTFTFRKLVSFIKQHGMPSKELLGKENYSHECVQGAFVAIMLHNPHMLVNNQKNMDFFVQLVEKGELKAKSLATILDKYYWVQDKILYGSQFGMPCKSNKAKTNKARKKIGLPPLADSLFIDCSNKKHNLN